MWNLGGNTTCGGSGGFTETAGLALETFPISAGSSTAVPSRPATGQFLTPTALAYRGPVLPLLAHKVPATALSSYLPS